MPNNLKDNDPKPTESMQRGGRIALSLKNAITWENCAELRKKLEQKIAEGRNEIILDFKQVTLLDSAALELLIDMHDALMNKGGVLKIVGINEVCRDILLATRIINILFVFKDMNEAITHKKT